MAGDEMRRWDELGDGEQGLTGGGVLHNEALNWMDGWTLRWQDLTGGKS